MFRNFAQMTSAVQSGRHRLAVVGAADSNVLQAVIRARHEGITQAVLLGDETRIRQLLLELNEPVGDYEI